MPHVAIRRELVEGVDAYPNVAPHGEPWSIGYEGREAGGAKDFPK